MGNADEITKFLSASATASDIGTLVADVANVYSVQLGTGDKFIDLRTKINNFFTKKKVM